MARRILTRTFDPAKKLVVRKSFVACGQTFGPGEEFDWQALGVKQRRVLQMFNIRMIDHPPTSVAPPDAPSKQPQPEMVKDDLSDLGMSALHEIARQEGVPLKSSKIEQRQAIREARRLKA